MTNTASITPERLSIEMPRRERILYGWLFWLLLAAFEIFLFSLPVMPSGDGPLHIYLSSILWDLASHSSSFYGHFYAIRHLVQPYSFHYYFLISLEHWFSPDVAEEIFVGCIWATLAIGFRQLAKTLGPAYPSVSLWAFPLLLSWPLGGGFFNYVFASGLLLFALAIYTRLSAEVRPGWNFGWFVLVLVLLVLSHPLPIMLLIFLIGIDIWLQILNRYGSQKRWLMPRWSIIAICLACLAFLFPILIADKAKVASSLETGIRLHLGYLHDMFDGIRIAYFSVNNVFGWLYDLALVAMVPVTILLSFRAGIPARLRSFTLTAADRLLLASLLYLLFTLFFPPDMNGSALFAVRMFFMIWLVAPTCAAGAVQGRGARVGIGATGLAISLLCLIFGWQYLRPIARQQWQIEHASIPSYARGLFIQTPSGDDRRSIHMNYSLLFWQGGRAFAAHHDVLLNTPWLQLTILPLSGRAQSGLLNNFAPNVASENPNQLAPYLQAHPNVKKAVLAKTDFLLIADPAHANPQPQQFADTLLGSDVSHWSCATQYDFAVCTKK